MKSSNALNERCEGRYGKDILALKCDVEEEVDLPPYLFHAVSLNVASLCCVAGVVLKVRNGTNDVLCFTYPRARREEFRRRNSRLLGLVYFISPLHSIFQFSA